MDNENTAPPMDHTTDNEAKISEGRNNVPHERYMSTGPSKRGNDGLVTAILAGRQVVLMLPIWDAGY